MINKQLRNFIKIAYYVNRFINKNIRAYLFEYSSDSRGLILIPKNEYTTNNEYSYTSWLIDISVGDDSITCNSSGCYTFKLRYILNLLNNKSHKI